MVMPKFKASVRHSGRVSLTSYARFNALRTPSTPRDAEYKVIASPSPRSRGRGLFTSPLTCWSMRAIASGGMIARAEPSIRATDA
jgi:hypothetical protein